jgi:hypothetical protein
MTKNMGISNYKLLEPKQYMNTQMSDTGSGEALVLDISFI